MCILVVYDGSDTAKKAVKRAVEMMEHDEELYLITVVPKPHMAAFMDVDLGESVENARKAAQEEADMWLEVGVAIKYIVKRI